MRTFYIFKIKNSYVKLTKDKPYNLYMILNGLYKSNIKDIGAVYSLYDSVCEGLDKKAILDSLKVIKDSDNYQVYGNIHKYYNYYDNENSKLIINNSYMVVKSNCYKPIFFNILNKIDDIFVCDFVNNDYFWLCDIKHLILV